MPMTPDKLKVYLPSKYLAADGDAIPQRTADAGGALNKILDAGLTEAADYWNGALGWFDNDSATAALRGLFFHVKTFDAALDTLTLSRDLPAVPGTGDNYRLILGGKWRSSREAYGMALDGALPELIPVLGVQVTGLTIKKASGQLGEQVLTIAYDFANDLLKAKVGAGAYGVGLDVSADVTDGYLYVEDGIGWVRVDVVAASLPGADQDDDWELTYAERTLTPDYEGYETRSPVLGKTRYRLEVVKNEGAVPMNDLEAVVSRPDGVATELDTGESLGLVAGAFDVVDATDWPAGGFWIRNETKDDCRYVDYRSGLTINCFGVDWAKLSFDAGIAQVFPGNLLEGATSLAQAYVDQVVLTSGTWGVDAAGYFLLKGIVGAFQNNESLEVAAVPSATADGVSVLGLRDKVAVAWDPADVVLPMCDVDLGTDAPAVLAFEDPADEATAPAAVSFEAADSPSTVLALGTLAAGDTMGVWRREWILYNHQPRAGVKADTVYTWE